LRGFDGGFFPIVILGVAVSAKAAAWIVAGCVFAVGVYVGYSEAAEQNEVTTAKAPGC
jgi:hypothetical protein